MLDVSWETLLTARLEISVNATDLWILGPVAEEEGTSEGRTAHVIWKDYHAVGAAGHFLGFPVERWEETLEITPIVQRLSVRSRFLVKQGGYLKRQEIC